MLAYKNEFHLVSCLKLKKDINSKWDEEDLLKVSSSSPNKEKKSTNRNKELNTIDKKKIFKYNQGMDHLVPSQVPSLLQHIPPSVIMQVLTCSVPVM